MFFKQRVHGLVPWIIFITFFSCGHSEQGSGDSGLPSSQSRGQNADNNGDLQDRKLCESSRVLKVLDNGKNVISRLGRDTNVIVKWNIITGKKESSLNFPVNPYLIGPNGKFIVRRIDFRKYQVIKLRNNKSDFNKIITLNAAYSPMPKLSFSPDGENLVLNYRPFGQGYSKQIDIYSLSKERITFSFNAKNISFAKLTRDSKSLLVSSKEDFQNVVQKINLQNSSVEFELNLNKYEAFSEAYLGEEVFVLRGNKGYYFHDLHSGGFLYWKRLKYLYDIGTEGENALVSERWNEIKIIDLKTGTEQLTQKMPTDIVLSTCKLIDSNKILLCEDSINQGRVTRWNLSESIFSSSCF